jgi:urease accessory protein
VHPAAAPENEDLDRDARRIEAAVPAGTGVLEIARSGGRSVVRRAFATSPLRLLTPRNHGSAAWIYTASYGGGLVNGDALHLTIDVAPESAALVSTQSATKVYRSPQGTSMRLDARVGARGLLVVAPDPVVCFAGSTCRQAQHVELGPDAGLVLLDWLSSGRRAAGERWAFDRYTSRTTIRYEGRIVFFDGVELSSRDGDLADRMGRFESVAVVAAVGPRLRSYRERLLAEVAEAPVVRHADMLISASPLGCEGVVVRIAGTSVEAVGDAIRKRLGFVPLLLGDDPWARKW